jgi:hypothetical protein
MKLLEKSRWNSSKSYTVANICSSHSKKYRLWFASKVLECVSIFLVSTHPHVDTNTLAKTVLNVTKFLHLTLAKCQNQLPKPRTELLVEFDIQGPSYLTKHLSSHTSTFSSWLLTSVGYSHPDSKVKQTRSFDSQSNEPTSHFYFLSQSAFDSSHSLQGEMFYKLSADNFTTTISIKLL